MSSGFSVASQAVACVFHYAAVVYVIVQAQDFSVAAVWSWNVWNEDPNNEDAFAITTFYEPTEDSVSLNVKIMVLLFSVISGTHHFIAVVSSFMKTDFYLVSSVLTGFNWIRWADYALSASLMLMVNTILLKAPADITTLIYVFLVQFMVCLGGAASEFAWSVDCFLAGKLFFAAFTVPFILTWASQIFWLYKSADHSEESGDKMPVFVWVYFALLLAGFCLFPVVHALKVWSSDAKSKERVSILAENRYAAASLLAKVPLLLLYSVSLERDNLEFTADTDVSNATRYNEIADDTTVFVTAGVSYLVCIITGIVILNLNKCCRCCTAGAKGSTALIKGSYNFLRF